MGMEGGNIRRITDFFQSKRPQPVQDLRTVMEIPSSPLPEELLARSGSDRDDASPQEEPSRLEDVNHPFFLAQAKRKREVEDQRNDFELFREWRTCREMAPLHPAVPLVPLPAPGPPGDSHGHLAGKAGRARRRPVYSGSFRGDYEVGQELLSKLDIHSERPLVAFDQDEFDRALAAIQEWIAPTTEATELSATDDLFVTKGGSPHRWMEERTQRSVQRPIVLLSGPPGCGKTRLAYHLADRMGIALCEIDNCVESRNGKPFEDILSASHGQRDALRRFLSPQTHHSSRTGDGIRMVVLVDQVDLVFPGDKFYSPLGAFLREVPSSILVILTANAGRSLVRKHVDLPSGVLCLELRGGGCDKAREMASRQEDDLRMLSDVDVLFPRQSRVECNECGQEDLPVTCMSYEIVKEEWSLYYGGPASDAGPTAASGDACALMRDLQREGWFIFCRRRRDWIRWYQPTWCILECEAAARNEARLRRTARPLVLRPYLTGIPPRFIERIRSIAADSVIK